MVYITLFMSLKLLCGTKKIPWNIYEYFMGIFSGTLSVLHNTVMNLNNDMYSTQELAFNIMNYPMIQVI